jgi:hypothetical protein
MTTDPEHHHTPEEERRIREAALDETLADTFPASDPPSSIPNPDDDEVLEEDDVPADRVSLATSGAGRPVGADRHGAKPFRGDGVSSIGGSPHVR